MSAWYTAADRDTEEVHELWPNVEQLGESTLDLLFDVAREQVLAYAPSLASDAPIPSSYALAQLRQAANMYNAAAADAGGQQGDPSSFAITPRPLDWHVKALLRPTRGLPRVR